jgi:hypothetical protein
MKRIFVAAVNIIVITGCQQQSAKTVVAVPEKKDTPVVINNKQEVFNALKKEELIPFLPDAKGFIRNGEPTGESAHTGKSGNKYYSYARQEYTKGNVPYTVEIVDYKDDTATFRGLVNMYNSLPKDPVQGETKMTKTGKNRFIINGISSGNDKKSLAALLSAVPVNKLPE